MARLDAELVVVDAVRCEAASLDHVRLCADDGDFRRIGDGDERRHRGGDDVVCRLIECINGADEALRGLLEVVDRRDRRDFDRQAFRLGIFLHCFDLDFGIDLARAIDRADGLGLRLDLQQQVDLLLDRVHIARARDVATRLLVRCRELRADIVRDGRADNRDVLRRICDRLRGRRRDGADEVHLARDEALRDVLEVRLVSLCVLLVELDVLVLLVATFLQAIDKALVRRIERVVLDELDDADFVRLARR